MSTATNRYLDAVKVQLDITSDNKLAAKWGVTQQRIGLYRRGETALSDERCIQVAEILGLPPEKVLFEIQAERARKAGKSSLADVLESVLRRLSATAAAITFGLCLSACFYADDSEASSALPYAESNTGLFRQHLTDNVNYAKCRAWCGLILQHFRRAYHALFAPVSAVAV